MWTAKAYATEAAARVASQAIEIHGGGGLPIEYPIERYFRDARSFTIPDGTTSLQKLVIGRRLLRGGGQRPIRRSQNRECELGTLILGAMVRDPSAAGRNPRADLDRSFARWRRLIETLCRYRGAGLTNNEPRGVWDVERYLALARIGPPTW